MKRTTKRPSPLPPSEDLLQLVLDTIPARVFWKDRQLNYLGCNRVFALDAGLSHPAEILGKNDFDLAWREQAELYRTDDRLVIESGAPKLFYEEPQTGPRGKKLWLRTSKIPLCDETGAVIGVMGTYEDITERKRLETELRHAQKMEAVGQLAGGVAHDLNNLLSPILGYVGLLVARLPQDEPSRRELAQVQYAAERAKQRIGQLLVFGRKQTLALEPVDLRAVLGGFYEILRHTIRENVRIELPEDQPPRIVEADVGQLELVLMNLAVNAQDAMPNGGVLRFSLDEVLLDREALGADSEITPGAYVRLRVSDTGCGMDAETASRVFEPFFTTKAADRGTGLGLATVYGVVRQHGGRVVVDSTPGAGATFCVYLPRSAEPVRRAGSRPVAARPPSGGGESVLVVEDNELVREFVCHVLRLHGYRVVAAESGAQGIEIAARAPGPFHLLVTDVIMPGMHGATLFARLRDLWPELKVVYMSGYDPGVLDPRTVAAQGAGFLQKPFASDALVEEVQRALDAGTGTKAG